MPTNVRAWISDGKLHVKWDWPQDKQIDEAIVVSRRDRPPTGPHDNERPQGDRAYVRRGDYRLRMGFSTPVAGNALFVRVFSALAHSRVGSAGGAPSKDYYFSDASVAVAKGCMARQITVIRMSWEREFRGRERMLLLASADGHPLPALRVVRRQGQQALSATAGETVFEANPWPQDKVSVKLDIAAWPPSTFLKVFALYEEIQPGLRVVVPGSQLNFIEAN